MKIYLFLLIFFASCCEAVQNGVAASVGDFPSNVFISTGTSTFCGGTVVLSDLVLTTASCVQGVNMASIQVYGGVTVGFDTSGQVATVREVLIHPLFSNTPENDIAMLRLTSSFNPSTQLNPLLLNYIVGEQLQLNDMVTLTGWGSTSATATPDFQLRSTSPQTVVACPNRGFDTCAFICTMPTTTSTLCSSDIGSPLVYQVSSAQLGGGFYVTGDECDGTSGGISYFIQFSTYSTWIACIISGNPVSLCTCSCGTTCPIQGVSFPVSATATATATATFSSMGSASSMVSVSSVSGVVSATAAFTAPNTIAFQIPIAIPTIFP